MSQGIYVRKVADHTVVEIPLRFETGEATGRIVFDEDGEVAGAVAAPMIASLVIGGVVLLAMIGVSCYGWVTLPADARVPIHFGAGYNNFVPKGLGLIMHPAGGAVIYVISAATTRNPAKAASAVYIFPVVMCVLLIVQIGAVKVARGRSGVIG